MAHLQPQTTIPPTEDSSQQITDVEKSLPATTGQNTQAHDDVKHERDDDDSVRKQDGVKRVEAITTVWSKQVLIAMFILLYLVSFVDQLLQSVQSNLVPWITSSFGQHGLLATTSIVASIIGGVCNLPIAKIIDIYGRVEGFILMLLLIVLGMIMKATCKNVETYAAANVFYSVGHNGMNYIISIILADITTLRNRTILFGLQQTPIIATVFAGPRIADLFYTYVNFRWAFGAFTIVLVAVCIPVIVVFLLSKRKAVRMGVYPLRTDTRTWWEATKYYVVEFDVLGMFLTIAGFSFLLLPFNLVSTAPHGWKTGYIIALIVLGVVLLAAFAVWEKYFAKVPYVPWKFLKDRTILGACLVYGIMFTSIFSWDTYYGSYLQAVHDQSITTSGYVLNSFSLMSSFIAPFIGLYIRHTGKFKWFSIAMIPFAMLGTGLLIKFRAPSSHIGLLVMCQLFQGIYSGTWGLTAQLAIQASVTHQEIAVVVALYGLFGSIGSSIGFAVAGALWTNIFPVKLLAELPDDAKDLFATIYGDLGAQTSYPLGSPIRNAVINAYADVQRKMVITGVCLIPLCMGCLFMWRNINVRKLEEEKGTQTKGTVF